MKVWTKISCCIVLFALVLACAPVSALAAENNPVKAETSAVSQQVQTTIKNGLTNMAEEINLSAYNIKRSQLYTIYQQVINDASLLFYVGKSYTVIYTPGGNDPIVSRIRPTYTCTKAEAEAMTTEIYSAAYELIAKIPASMADFDKLLLIHDFLCEQITYAESDTAQHAHDLYGALVRKEAVCEGYAKAFQFFLDYYGMENVYVYNETHAWNMVKLNGKWYHIDTTWDDPVPDRYGYAAKTYFLLNDMEISADKGHLNRSESGILSSSTAYSDLYFRDLKDGIACVNGYLFIPYQGYLLAGKSLSNASDTVRLFSSSLFDVHAVASYGDYLYFINGTSLFRIKIDEQTDLSSITTASHVKDLSEIGLNPYDTIYSMIISKDGLCKISTAYGTYRTYLSSSAEEEIFFANDYYFRRVNQTAEIVKYIGGGTRVEIPLTLDGLSVTAIGANAFSGSQILKVVLVDKNIRTIADSAFADCPQLSIYGFSDTAAQKYAQKHHIPFISLDSVQLGDVSRDGIINGKDATLLLRHAAGWSNLNIELSAADINRDGTVSGKDATLLLRHLAGWKGIL